MGEVTFDVTDGINLNHIALKVKSTADPYLTQISTQNTGVENNIYKIKIRCIRSGFLKHFLSMDHPLIIIYSGGLP